jgi:hypothetical protein
LDPKRGALQNEINNHYALAYKSEAGQHIMQLRSGPLPSVAENHMKKILHSLLFTVIQVGIALSQTQTNSVLEWNKLGVAWHQYISNPIESNGLKVYSLLPNEEYGITEPDSVFYNTWYSIYENLDKLESLVKIQNRIAIKVAFKLYSISDADFTESLDQILGRLIRINPKLFLEALKLHRELVGDLGGILENLGNKFVDEEDLSKKEIKKRIQSLEKVKVKSLIGVRDESIIELKTRLR